MGASAVAIRYAEACVRVAVVTGTFQNFHHVFGSHDLRDDRRIRALGREELKEHTKPK